MIFMTKDSFRTALLCLMYGAEKECYMPPQSMIEVLEEIVQLYYNPPIETPISAHESVDTSGLTEEEEAEIIRDNEGDIEVDIPLSTTSTDEVVDNDDTQTEFASGNGTAGSEITPSAGMGV